MEMDGDADDVMEIDPSSSSWQNPQPPQPECIDMTSDDDTPVVINIQEKDTASGLLKSILNGNKTQSSSKPTTVEQSISKLNEISLTSLDTNEHGKSATNDVQLSSSPSRGTLEETDCIEIDDDISICDLPADSSGGPKEVASNLTKNSSANIGNRNRSGTSNLQKSSSQTNSNQKVLDHLIETCVDNNSNTTPASVTPDENSNKNGSLDRQHIGTKDDDDDDCQMVILTDDEEKDEETSSHKNSEPSASNEVSTKSVAKVVDDKCSRSNAEDHSSVLAKSSSTEKNSSGKRSAETNDEDCEMVILTDDEEKDESPSPPENSKASVDNDKSVKSYGRVVDKDESSSSNIKDDASAIPENTLTEKNSLEKQSVETNDGDCEMVILTDDEEKDERASSPVSSKISVDDGQSVKSDKKMDENKSDSLAVQDGSAVAAENSSTVENPPEKPSAETEDKDCEMVILTDEESIPDDKEESQSASSSVEENSATSVKSIKSDAKEIETGEDSGNEKKNVSAIKSADNHVKTSNDLDDKDCEMIVITDDDVTPEKKDVKQASSSISDAVVESNKPFLPLTVINANKSVEPKVKDGVKASAGSGENSRTNNPVKTDKKSETIVLTDENKTEGKNKEQDLPKSVEGTIVGKAINPNLKDDDKFKAPKPPDDPVEVIDVDVVRERRVGSSECVNPNCKSGRDLRGAENFVIAYYNVKPKKGLKMCAECYNIAMTYADELLKNLVKHKSIFDVPYNPDSLVVSLDLDSDDESEKKNANPSQKRKRLPRPAEKFLDEEIQKVLDKYDYKYQMEEGNKKVTSEIDRIKAEFDSMKLEIDDHKKTLDDMYEKIHGPYRPKHHQLNDLSIIDCQVRPHGFKVPLKTPRVKPLSFRIGATGPQGAQAIIEARPKPFSQAPSRSRAAPAARLAVATKKVTPYNKTSNAVENRKPVPISSDIVQLAPSKISPPPNLPNHGPLIRAPIKPNQVVYFMKSTLYGVWIPGKVVKVAAAEKKHAPFKFMYKIRPEPLKKYQDAYRSVLGKFMAYYHPASVRLPVGTRVVAIFKEENGKHRSDNKFYAGVIAEPPKSINKFRYLVFFDDGYAQYISHEEIRVVCESSPNVWDDVLPDFKDFIRRYLLEYPERPMVKLQKKQMVKTEWNGKWWIARVMEIDSSLVKMLFDADRRVEWIYRGSTRLGPLFAAHKRQETGDRLVRGLNSNFRQRNLPYVEYTRQESDTRDGSKDTTDDDQSAELSTEGVEKRAVARKSGTGKPMLPRAGDREKKANQPIIPNTRFTPARVPSKLDMVDTSRAIRPKLFIPHQCGPKCISWVGYSVDKARSYGPLAVPLLFGFERVLTKVKNKNVIFYIAPCGRRLRDLSEIHRYLRITKSEMTVDQFSFDDWVNCLSEFKITKCFNYIKDLSYGKEKQPISCVNYLDNLMPQYVHYITEREPREGVHLNLDPDFLVCCDCTDDCQDKEKCACWRLTMDNQKIIPGIDDSELSQGYMYRRLPERIVTGIYECNSRCRCSKTSCLNRVVQHPLMQKLQLFKTERKGWGIRCLNDIPMGSFICIYAGHLLTESSANEEGKNYGDEYLAELDYIEVIERIKDDYEESVPSELMTESEKSEESSDEDDDEEDKSDSRPISPGSRRLDSEFELKCAGDHQSEFRMMLRKKPEKPKKNKKDNKSSSDQEKSSGKDDEEGDSDGDDRRRERAPLHFNATLDEDPENDKDHEKSLRNLFGEDECVYVMDAKCNGNIGRYLNHSCEPNVFVQNVFVDTHDLRFPWVAFFALNYISAGTELTWDYNYDVNSVPGKVLYCYCNSNECRGRLL